MTLSCFFRMVQISEANTETIFKIGNKPLVF
jgi:hypothetical protein